jgi:nucleotide-binding universal stress UspA family protein
VLLAADESDAARAGEEWIRRLRWARTPEIDVLTVAPRPGWASGIGLQTYRTAVRDAVIQAGLTELLEAQRIANTVGSRLQEAGVRVRVWARHGGAAEEIVRMARLEATDLIVVGSSGRSSRALLWGQSVATRVARDSDGAVLVAQPPPPGADRLPRAVALLVGQDAAAADALRWLAAVGWLRETPMTLARIDRPGATPPDTTVALRQVADRASVAGTTETVLPSDRRRSIEALTALVEHREIDLLVWPRGDGRAADEAVRVADAARVSVLLVP